MLLAVMDLGSNSFKMTIAQWAPEVSRQRPFRVLHKERHPIQLGGSVFEKGSISEKDRREALRSLAKMQTRLRDFSGPVLRAIGTSALREARNGRDFVTEAQRRLGLRIEVISGHEEARLIAQGLNLEFPRARRGVLVDIGGGSTEIASFGSDWASPYRHSFRAGSVRLASRFFAGRKKVDLEAVRRAVAMQLRVPPPRRIDRLVGSAGTIQSLGKILATDNIFTLAQLDRWIREHYREKPAQIERHFKVPASRARVLVPGAILLSEVLRWLGQKQIRVTAMTLRDGVMVDLVKKWQREESEILKKVKPARRRGLSPGRAVRMQAPSHALVSYLERTVPLFHEDAAHARHMAKLSLSIFDQLVAQGAPLSGEERNYLVAAAYLHDIGRIVNESGHQKHSGYIIRNLQIPEMNSLDTRKIALITLYHRKEAPPRKGALPGDLGGLHALQVRRMAAILRLADGLDHDHQQNTESLVLQISRKQAVFELIQRRPVPADMSYFREKSAYFEELFGLKVVTFVRPRR